MINQSQLLNLYRSALHSVQPESLIQTSIRLLEDGTLLFWDRRKLASKNYKTKLTERPIYIFGAGKAVIGMCTELLNQISVYNKKKYDLNFSQKQININRGRLNVPIGSICQTNELFSSFNVSIHECAKNNIPDYESVTNSTKIIEMLKNISDEPNDTTKPLVIGFISGGGSALLSLPKEPITIEQKQELIKQLVGVGATISELNQVRGAISQLKCGQLSNIIVNELKCELLTFIISDIIGDPIDLIASGPTVMPTYSSLPMDIIDKYDLKLSDNIRKTLEQHRHIQIDKTLSSNESIHNIIIGNNSTALETIQIELEKLGFKLENLGSEICGEASDVIRMFLFKLLHSKESRNICWIGGGETTITLGDHKNIGLGGRCQEMGLICLHELMKLENSGSLNIENGRLTLMFVGTDGQDGPTPSAGVSFHYPLNENLKFDQTTIESYLSRHDSHNFFRKHFPSALIETGPSGTNVMDIYCLIYEINKN
ncbi:hypothetical protein RDWZM_002283 [Blomia tropicalis]|uniref:Glycerate kinase n=1 Tax=Blomia tropicalis TaxID=40697 RepID=A0A9Q0MEV0_BLOTA|nr:hypothetical protein RDWZM_002283 [Blomia tropicalis]